MKSAVKNNTGGTLRMNIKMFDGNNLPHELSMTTRQKIKLRNEFENNMSTDIKLSKAQVSKLIRSREFLGSWLSKLACLLMKVEIPLGKKKHFSSIGNNTGWRSSKENAWFW